MGLFKKRVNDFPTPYTVKAAAADGGIETKLSMLVMGLGNMMHKQVVKGLMFLAVEVLYLLFMVQTGFHCLAMLPSLGSVEQQEVWNEALQIYEYTQGDNSVLILLYGVATVMLTLLMVWVWRGTVKSAYKAECLDKAGKHVNSFIEDVKTLGHENVHRLLMTPSLTFIFGLTVLPLIFMICMAFTNYSKLDNHLVLFDWVGLDNLIATFTGNVNNFNIIYLLSGGDPVVDLASTAGSTDLLVTWLYKLTIDKQYYNIGAVIGILTFIILAVGALLTYRNSKSYKDEEGF